MQEQFLHMDEFDEPLIPLCLTQSRMHAEENKSSRHCGICRGDTLQKPLYVDLAPPVCET
jgi:hypothetical protein